MPIDDDGLGPAEGSPQSVQTGTVVDDTSSEAGAASSEATSAKAAAETAKLAKRVEDLERMRSEALSRADKAESRNKELETTVLAKLADTVAGSSKGKSDAAQQALIAEWKERIDNGDATDTMEYVSSLVGQVEGATKKELADMKAQLEQYAAIAAELPILKRTLEDRDPVFLARREHVLQLAEEMGMDPVKDRATLMMVSKKLDPTLGQTPREIAPGNTGRTRVVDDEPTQKELDPERIALMEETIGPLSDAEKAFLKTR